MKRLLFTLALTVGSISHIGVGAAAIKIPTHDLSAKGGTVTFSTTVKNARSCAWSSSPKVAGFDATVKCVTGKVARTAKVKANSLLIARDYMLTLTVKGKTTTVDHLKVEEAGKVAVTSVTSTTTVSTTTTAPTTTTHPAPQSFTPTISVTVVPILSSATSYYLDINLNAGLPGSLDCAAIGSVTVVLTFGFPLAGGKTSESAVVCNNSIQVNLATPMQSLSGTVSFAGGTYADLNGGTVILEPSQTSFTVSA